MKKLFVIAMLATVGMAACSKDDTAPAAGPKKYVQVTIPEDMVSGETRTSIDGTTTNWVAGDKVAVLLYDGAAMMTCQFTADKSGPTTTFSGDVPIGSYSLAAAYYPYDCNATFDAVNKTFKHTWGSEYCTTWPPMTSCIRTSGRSRSKSTRRRPYCTYTSRSSR